MNRREFVKVQAGLVLVGGAALAGCTGDGEDDEGVTYVPNEPSYGGWFDGVSNYKGTVEARGQSEVTVRVGVQGNSGYYKYGPAAVAVSPETSITWEWTGRGGTHNVRERTGAFDSCRLVNDEGHTYRHTLEDPGVYKYVCDPHVSMGMKGAVFVALGEQGT